MVYIRCAAARCAHVGELGRRSAGVVHSPLGKLRNVSKGCKISEPPRCISTKTALSMPDRKGSIMSEATIQPFAGSDQGKTCTRCRYTKPATSENFSKIKAKDCWHSWCKPCCAEDRRNKRAENPEHYSALEKARHARDKDKRLEASRKLWLKNADQYRVHQAKRMVEMRDEYNQNRRKKLQENPELRSARAAVNKEWRDANAERVSASRKQKWANATIQQRLRSLVGSAISHTLKGKTKGGRSWQVLVGYKAGDLVQHIERQFAKGMSWANYGQWHVDHIIPASSFKIDDADDPELKACWALSNLRPLWAGDNIRKRDKRTHLI